MMIEVVGAMVGWTSSEVKIVMAKGMMSKLARRMARMVC